MWVCNTEFGQYEVKIPNLPKTGDFTVLMD